MNQNHKSLLLICFFVVLALLPAYSSSPTTDEIGFMASGLAHWETSQFEPYAVNPPLMRMLATLPVYLMRPKTDWSHLIPNVYSRSEVTLGTEFIAANKERAHMYYFVGRVVNVMVGAICLLLTMRWATIVFGERSGIMAGCLTCFCPLILGHGSMITPDVGAAMFGVLAFMALRNWLLKCELATAIWMGVCVGFAFCAKFSWIPVLPPCFVVLWLLWRSSERALFLRRDVLQICCSMVVALVLINCLYGFDRTLQPLGSIPFVSDAICVTADQPASSYNRFSHSLIAGLPIPLPLCLLQGIDLQKSGFENEEFSRSYLMGNWKNRGWWYYYIVGVAVKSPLPILILSIFAIGIRLFKIGSFSTDKLSHSNWGYANRVPLWLEQSFMLVPAISIFAFVSAETGFNRHLRYVLPAYPFLIVFISQVSSIRHAGLRQLVKCLLILQAVSVLWHGPHWLSYFNEASGGPKRGGQWMLVSNIDWGQDFYYLRNWQVRHPEARPFKLALQKN